MPTNTVASIEDSRASKLAKQLELDIQRRGLRRGDSYMTADGVSEWLGISRMAANRAMNVLAHRQILVRQRSRGTFIGPAVEEPSDMIASKSKCVHLITFVDDSPEVQLPLGGIMAGGGSSF